MVRALDSVRKAAFTGVTILLNPAGPSMQAWGALLLLQGFIVLFMYADPYLENWLNQVERQALVTDAATLFLSLHCS